MLQGRQRIDKFEPQVLCKGFKVVAFEHRRSAAAMFRREHGETRVERQCVRDLLCRQHASQAAFTSQEDDVNVALQGFFAFEVDEALVVALTGKHACCAILPCRLPCSQCGDQLRNCRTAEYLVRVPCSRRTDGPQLFSRWPRHCSVVLMETWLLRPNA